jgi:Flp pilus assembly protein TadD
MQLIANVFNTNELCSAYFCSYVQMDHYIALPLSVNALKAQDVQQLRETARNFQRQGDYENTILVLNKAETLAPTDPDVQKELGIAYYVSRQYAKALEHIKPLTERADADEQTYQITGLVYRSLQNFKEADKIYKQP